MATSTVRFAIIVALVVVGAIVIAQFPKGATVRAASTATPTPTSTPTGGGGQGNGNINTGGGQQQPGASLAGVNVAVYNGTTQTGLAADIAAALVRKFGVTVNPQTSILNAPSIPVDLTTIYYVTAADKAPASDLADSYFKKLPSPPKVQKLPSNTTVPPGVQVAVYLGMDYVNAIG